MTEALIKLVEAVPSGGWPVAFSVAALAAAIAAVWAALIWAFVRVAAWFFRG